MTELYRVYDTNTQLLEKTRKIVNDIMLHLEMFPEMYVEAETTEVKTEMLEMFL